MLRTVIQIDESKCNGCGICADACHEGAIAIIDGKARLTRDDYCDGMGDCLPACPTDAISFIEREAAAVSQLRNWPVQIKLAPLQAPYFDGAHLLIAADCCAYSYGNFHADFMKNKVALIGCPKLDGVDYTEKLTEIIKNNDIKSVTMTRMEVPCCGGLEYATVEALKASGKFIPWNIVTFSLDGKILEN